MRSLFLLSAPWAALLAALWLTTTPVAGSIGTLTGAGWAGALTCATCIGGGALILASGWGAIVGAIWQTGSTLALAGCIAGCADVLL